ncbi:hypothetical protein B0O99DRAFT_683193 [Bisporella sp. PMI_857]|nr:hypothetical protein B0O99DRAFT_683193 [Bisporella sp. PMI_857]
MRRSISIFAHLSITTFLLVPTNAAATCYRPDTKANVSEIYVPCNMAAPASMCWRSQRLGPAPPDASCLPNGLTLNINRDGGNEFWRQGCTDPTWQSPYCLKAFNQCSNDMNGNAWLTSCDGTYNSTEWCCGSSNEGCCGTPQAIVLAQTLVVTSTSTLASSTSTSASSTSTSASSTSTSVSSTSTSVSSTSTSASSTSTSASSTTTSQTPTSPGNPSTASVPNTAPEPTVTPVAAPSSSSKGLSTGAKAGIGASGAIVGCAALLGLTWLLLRKRRAMRPSRIDAQQLDAQQLDADQAQIFEAEHKPSEAPGSEVYGDNFVELDATRNYR